MTDATLGAAVVDDLFGIRAVAPKSRFPNADVGILDGQQQNVIIVAIIEPVPPRNVVEILLDEVAQPLQVGILPQAVRGQRATTDFLSSAMARGPLGYNESSAAVSPMSFKPISGFRCLINLSIPSKHNASR
jgi:hypothetical protein